MVLLGKASILRRDTEGKEVIPEYKLPAAEGPLPLHWHRIQVPGFHAVHWSYNEGLPPLVCNGILVPHGHVNADLQFRRSDSDDYDRTINHLSLSFPSLSVFDPDGRLPLSLAHDRLARSPVDLETRIVDDVCRNFIAFCVARGPQSRMLSKDQFASYSRLTYPGYSGRSWLRHSLGFFFETPDGFGISDPWNLSHFSSARGLLIRAPGRHFQISQTIAYLAKEKYGLTCGVESDGTLWGFDYWHRRLVLHSRSECLPLFRGLKLRGLRILMPVEWYERFCSKKQPKFVVNSTQVESKTSDSVTLTVDDCPSIDPVLATMADDLRKNQVPFESITEFYVLPTDQHPTPGRIAKLWQEVIGGPIIPLNKVERQRIAAKLPVEFERHLAEWKGSEKPKRTRK